MSLNSDSMWRYHPRGHGEHPREYTPYDNPANSYDLARVSALHRSWSRFCEQYPHNAELLRLLFGQHAKSAHFEYSVIPESKAAIFCQSLKTTTQPPSRRVDNLTPMGDC